MSKLYVDEIASKTNATDAMTIDSSGRILMPNKPLFMASGNASGYTNVSGSNTIISAWNTSDSTISILQGGMSFSSSGVTVPVAGIYEVFGSVIFKAENAEYGLLMIYRNNDRITLSQKYNQTTGGTVEDATVTKGFVNCAAGDVLSLREQGSGAQWYNNGVYGTFSVQLIG